MKSLSDNHLVENESLLAENGNDNDNHLSELLANEFKNANNHRFGYLRCLEYVDRLSFQSVMVGLIIQNCKDNNTQKNIITQGCMRMHTWRRIMKKVKLVNTYKLWRSAYWGENAGPGRKYCTVISRYHVLVEQFDGLNLNGSKANGSKTKAINLLCSGGHIAPIPASLIWPADWSSEDASTRLWEEICD